MPAEYNLKREPQKGVELGVTGEHTLFPRMTWRDRARRLWGFFGRRENIVRQDLSQMASNAQYFGERHSHLFSRVPYYETHSSLEEPMQSDLRAVFEGNLSHFEVREHEFHDPEHAHIGRMYTQLRQNLQNLQNQNNTFRDIFARNLHNRALTNPIVRSGPFLTRWWGFWRRTEERIDREPPRVAEAWNHFYQGSEPHGTILQLLRNIYTARSHGIGGHPHPPTPPPHPPEGGGGQGQGSPIVFQPHIEVNPQITASPDYSGYSPRHQNRIGDIRNDFESRRDQFSGQGRPGGGRGRGGGSGGGSGSRPTNRGGVNVNNTNTNTQTVNLIALLAAHHQANYPRVPGARGAALRRFTGPQSRPITGRRGKYNYTVQDYVDFVTPWHPRLGDRQQEMIEIAHKQQGELTHEQTKYFQKLFPSIKLGKWYSPYTGKDTKSLQKGR